MGLLVSSNHLVFRGVIRKIQLDSLNMELSPEDMLKSIVLNRKKNPTDLEKLSSLLKQQFLVSWTQMALKLLQQLKPTIGLTEILSSKGIQQLYDQMRYSIVWPIDSWPRNKLNMRRSWVSPDSSEKSDYFTFKCLSSMDLSSVDPIEMTPFTYRQVLDETRDYFDQLNKDKLRTLLNIDAKTSVVVLLSMYAHQLERFIPTFLSLWLDRQTPLRVSVEKSNSI